MRKSNIFLSLIAIAIISLVLVSCGGGGKGPSVDPANVYTEADDEANNSFSDAEQTKITLDGKTTYEITGTYSSHEDGDYYRVDIDPTVFGNDTTYKVEMTPKSEGEVVGKLMALGFPATATSYDAEDMVVMNFLLIGTSRGFDVSDNTAYFIISTRGKKAEEGAVSAYDDGKSYSFVLK